MWCEEIVGLSVAGIDVAHHHEETGVLKMEVHVSVDYRVVANLSALLSRLYGILSHQWTVVRSVVFREEPHVGTQVTLKHLGFLEAELQICIYVQSWYRQNTLLSRLLPCDDILPVERTKCEVLA